MQEYQAAVNLIEARCKCDSPAFCRIEGEDPYRVVCDICDEQGPQKPTLLQSVVAWNQKLVVTLVEQGTEQHETEKP